MTQDCPEGCADNGESTGLPLMQPTKWFLRLPPPRGAAVFFSAQPDWSYRSEGTNVATIGR